MSVEESNENELSRLKSDIGNDLVQLLKKTLKENDKDVFGAAVESIEYFKDDEVVGSLLDYIYNIEFGREAGSHVPIQPIKEWIYVKLGIFGEEADRMAYAIEKKIYKSGIPMTRFAKISLERFKG